MTEPDRTYAHARVLAVLALALRRCPNLRVGQLIANALPPSFDSDPFCIEDAALAEALLRFSEAHSVLRKASR